MKHSYQLILNVNKDGLVMDHLDNAALGLQLFRIFSTIFSFRSLRIILPEGDFGIASTKWTTLTFL